MELNILPDTLCLSFMEEGEVDSFRHFLLYYPAFARLRLTLLGRHTFGESSEVVVVDINRLNKFVVSTKGFVNR